MTQNDLSEYEALFQANIVFPTEYELQIFNEGSLIDLLLNHPRVLVHLLERAQWCEEYGRFFKITHWTLEQDDPIVINGSWT